MKSNVSRGIRVNPRDALFITVLLSDYDFYLECL